MKPALTEIVDLLENLAVRFDSLEQVLIQKGVLASGELGLYDQVHSPVVGTYLSTVRQLIARLPQ